MSKSKYYSNNKSNNNHSNQVSTYNRILKLKNLDQIKAINSVFAKHVSSASRSVKDLYKVYHKIEPLKSVFVDYTINKWQKASGMDYKDGLNIPSQYINPNGHLSKNRIEYLLQELEKDTYLDHTMNIGHVFVIDNDKFYHQLKTCKKEIIGEMIIDSHNKNYGDNVMTIRHLLLGTINNEKYLFFSDLVASENFTEVSISLNLLVNGHEKGIKPLERLDTVGHLHPDLLDKLGIEYRLRDSTNNKLVDPSYKHQNGFSPTKKDPVIPTTTTGHIHQMHTASAMQDTIYAAAYYLKNSLNLPGYLRISNMSALDVDIFKSNEKTLYQVINEQKEEAIKYNGMITTERIHNFACERFNITTARLTKEFYDDIDKGRSGLHQHNLPRADYLLHQAITVDNILHNSKYVQYVPTQRLLGNTKDPNYKYANYFDNKHEEIHEKLRIENEKFAARQQRIKASMGQKQKVFKQKQSSQPVHTNEINNANNAINKTDIPVDEKTHEH